MELHRQEVPRNPRGEPPQRVPETKPPLLGDWFIYLSVVVLICGVVAITALELGDPLESPLVRFPAIIAAALLTIVAADGALRTWRSAWAWLPIDSARGLQRFVWSGLLVGTLLVSLGVTLVLLSL